MFKMNDDSEQWSSKLHREEDDLLEKFDGAIILWLDAMEKCDLRWVPLPNAMELLFRNICDDDCSVDFGGYIFLRLTLLTRNTSIIEHTFYLWQ